MVIDDLERLADLVAGGELEEEDALASLPRSSRPVFLERLRSAIAESEPAGMFAEPPPLYAPRGSGGSRGGVRSRG